MAQQPTGTPAAPTPRDEMWLITLAKSKTMRFFAVSCEFMIFLGCLWLTLVTILPDAAGWLSGGIDNFFLVSLGFAVDAALPEAWLHVVDQYTTTPRKIAQLRWSVPIAIGMLLLVVANFIYAKLEGTTGAQPSGAMETVVNILLIARMFIGISYVTIRECQSFLDRKQTSQQPATPALPDLQQQIAEAIAEVSHAFEQRLADLALQVGQIASSAAVDVASLTEEVTRQVEAHQEAALRQHLASGEARFQTAMRQYVASLEARVEASISSMRQRTIVSEAREARSSNQLEAPRGRHEGASDVTRRGPETAKIVALRQPEAAMSEKRAAVYRLIKQDRRLSSYAIAEQTGIPVSTVQRYLKDWKSRQTEAGQETAEAGGEATGTAE